MKRIILDTNFLMIPLQFRVDIFAEIDRICSFNYGLWVYSSTVDELRKISKGPRGKNAAAARFALKLISLKGIKVLESEGAYADISIVKNLEKGQVVATQDLKLKRQLASKGIDLIIMRKKKFLQYEKNHQ